MDVAGLARLASSADRAGAPEAVRDRTVDLVADVVAACAAASARPELRRLVDVRAGLDPDGPATVIGSPRGVPVATAVLLNGAAAAADQLQDGHRLARGHPAAHVVPVALALAEARDLRGASVLSAVLAGYEVGVRVGMWMGGTPDGVHDIGTWGQVGVSATVARLLAPGDVDVMRRAIELSAAAVLLTDARTVFAGRTGSHLFLGASAEHGLSAGLAAVARLAPEPGSLTRHFAAVTARSPAPAAVEDHEILRGYVKRHPTCAHLHGVNDAVAELSDVDAHRVVDVEVRTFAGAASFDEVADTELAARFSIPTSVAVGLHTGLDGLSAEVVADPAVRALAEKVRVVHDPALDDDYPAGRPSRVRVTLDDGTVREASCDRPAWDDDPMLTREALADKALRLLRHCFGPAGDEVHAAVLSLADDAPARHLGSALRAASRPGEGHASGACAR
ncbi:MAG: hypothetical protein ABS81_06420 [Pseudonocardia sp. SCN 72-86]|nr:MAG: hypothetical protein ABS81_06420 [Pseudonocardia sp. SCN 72-86]